MCRINDVNDQQAKWRIRDELDIETRAVSLITEPPLRRRDHYEGDANLVFIVA